MPSPTGRAATANRPSMYRLAATAAIILVTSATIVYRVGENWSWVDSLYFSVIAVTTVGFGDLAPTNDVTKLFTIFYVLSGITVVGLVLHERLRRHHQALEWIAERAER